MVLGMKFAIKGPQLYRGMITSTGFAGRSFFLDHPFSCFQLAYRVIIVELLMAPNFRQGRDEAKDGWKVELDKTPSARLDWIKAMDSTC